MFRLAPEYNITTIVTKPTVDESLLKDIQQFITEWPLVSKLKPRLRSRLILSTKAGPNGPASIACIEDLKPLRESKELYDAVSRMLDITMPGC